MKEVTDHSRRWFKLPVWWLASLLFHALLFGWLMFLSPVRVIDLAAKPAGSSPQVSPARAAKVMEQVRVQQAEVMAGELQALTEARRELTELEAAKRDELRQEATRSPVPLEMISAAQENAVKAQAAAVDALKQADDLSPPVPADTSATVQAAQTEAARFQGEALEALVLGDPKFEQAYQAQAAANSIQARAAQAQRQAEEQLAAAGKLMKEFSSSSEDLEEAKAMLRAAESQLAAAVANSEALGKSLPGLLAEAAAAETEMVSAQAGSDKSAATATKKRASDARKAADNARKNLTRAESDMAKFRQRISRDTERVAKLSANQGLPGTNPEVMRSEAGVTLREAQRLQTDAMDAQAGAAKAFADASNGVSSAAPVSVPEDLAGVYQAARQTETELAETYRRLRATELAMQRGIPLAKAMELTEIARPSRLDLAAALSGSPGSGADAQRQAVLDARSQIAAMRSLADSMLGQARGLGAGAGRQQALAELAAEDDNQRAKDLTDAMLGGSGSGNGTPGSGSGGGGSGDGLGLGNGGGSGLGTGSGLPGSGEGSGSGPPALQKNLLAVPGRVIGANTIAGRWMFVDSWYLLGPFDNAGRVNIDKQFPPESVVDLSATYVGKRGRPVKWEFHQASQPRIAPPFDEFNPLPSGVTDGGAGEFKARSLEYIIYYGYTELRAVEECEVWIAVGSDDFSKLWIEDQLVWASGKKHKSWRVDEGFRKVRLKQGVSRVLFRVENGHSQSEFSLAVCGQ